MPVASGSAQTQFAMNGSMTRRYGSFAGKTEFIDVTDRRDINGVNAGTTLTTYLESVTLVQDASLNWWIVD